MRSPERLASTAQPVSPAGAIRVRIVSVVGREAEDRLDD
jgi:hypothetical protein